MDETKRKRLAVICLLVGLVIMCPFPFPYSPMIMKIPLAIEPGSSSLAKGRKDE